VFTELNGPAFCTRVKVGVTHAAGSYSVGHTIWDYCAAHGLQIRWSLGLISYWSHMMRPTRRHETSVNFNHMSSRNNPQQSDSKTHRCKNLELLKVQMWILPAEFALNIYWMSMCRTVQTLLRVASALITLHLWSPIRSCQGHCLSYPPTRKFGCTLL